MSFVIGRYRAVERPGAGHHAAPVGLWRGEDLQTVDEVALTVLPIDCADAAEAAVEEASGVEHDHLLPVVEVATNDERIAVVCPWPRGGRLSELVARRGRLTPAETLTVLSPLAAVLAEIHRHGIRHGGVCPEAVWFDAAGRPLLGALAVGRVVAALNNGLPAACRDVAPEVVRGESPGRDPATPSADLFSLGSVALFCLTGRSAWPADDPIDVLVQSAAGLWPDPPDDAGPAPLLELVRELLRSEPAARPSAAAVAAELAGIGEPAPVAFGSGPAPATASADRWRGWGSHTPGALERGSGVERAGTGEVLSDETGDQAGDSDRADDDRGDGHREDGKGDGDGGRDDESDWPPGGGSRRALRRARRPPSRFAARFQVDPAAKEQLLSRSMITPDAGDGNVRPTARAKVGIAVLSGLLILLVGLQVFAYATGLDGPAASDAQRDRADPLRWSAIVTELDAARGAAFAAADPGLLADVYTDDAAAKLPDAATIEQLRAAGWRVPDAVHQFSDVTPLDAADPADAEMAGPAQGSTAELSAALGSTALGSAAEGSTALGPTAEGEVVRLAVTDVLPARPIVDGAGQQVGETPARGEQRRILTMVRTADGYRIGAIESG